MIENKENKTPFYILLKKTRESKEIDLQTISNTTKVNIKYLEAIENGDLDIVPPTYIRLFIRTFAKYLRIDCKEILKNYEEETNLKSKNIFKNLSDNKINTTKEIIETRNLSIQHKEPIEKKINLNKKNLVFDEPINQKEFNLKEHYFLKPKKIASFILTFVSILCIYLLISYLSNTQQKNIAIINSEKNITNNNIEEQSKPITPLIDNLLLSSDNFNKNNLVKTGSFKLKYNLGSPYTFQIVTKEKTKLYISYDDENGLRKEECNIIARKDSLLKYKKINNIYFDLWSAQHVQIAIDNKSISKYLGKDDYTVRGSFEPGNKLLYLEFYTH